MPRKLLRVASGLMFWVGCANALLAQQCADTCLSALKAAAHDEYHITEQTNWEQHFHQAFCDAIHQLQTHSSNTNTEALTAYFYANLNHNDASLAEYDRLYCKSTTLDTSYSNDYSFWSKVVKSDALSKFNSCMAICKPPDGLITDAQVLDTCHFVAKAQYRPTSSKNAQYAKLDRDASLVNASCAVNFYKGQRIDEQGRQTNCQRYGREGSFVILNTDQGGAVISVPPVPLPPKPAAIPDPPQFDSVDPTTNQRYIAIFKVYKHTLGTSGLCAGNTCAQTLSVPENGVIPSADNITYECSSGKNQNGDYFCGWSYNPAGGRGKNVTVTGGSFTWRRFYDTDQDMVETYTVNYLMPHKATITELQYRKDLAEWQKKAAVDPCPWDSKSATSWWDRLFGKQ